MDDLLHLELSVFRRCGLVELATKLHSCALVQSEGLLLKRTGTNSLRPAGELENSKETTLILFPSPECSTPAPLRVLRWSIRSSQH